MNNIFIEAFIIIDKGFLFLPKKDKNTACLQPFFYLL
jgi:hypothetical protein